MPHVPQSAAFAGDCKVTVAANAEIKTEDARAIFRLDDNFITPPWITNKSECRVFVIHATREAIQVTILKPLQGFIW
jgi:hypothetical protein